MNSEMVHRPQQPTSIPQYFKLLAAMHHMTSALVKPEHHKTVRAGITKNHSKGISKARRRMEKQSRKQNRSK